MPKQESSSLVKFERYRPEDAEADKQAAAEDRPGGKYAEIIEGKNKFRFLPLLKGERGTDPEWERKHTRWGGRKTYIHYVDVPGENERVGIVCPKYEEERKCILCDEELRIKANAEKLRKAGKSGAARQEKDRAYGLSAKRRVYANVIDRSKPQSGPLVLGIGVKIEDRLVAIGQDPEDGGDFTDPGPEGFDVVIERTGKKRDTKYETSAARNRTPLTDDVKLRDEWLRSKHDLEDCVRVYTDEEMEKLIAGEKLDDGDDRPPPRKVKSTVSRTIEDDVVDDDDAQSSDDVEDIAIE